MPIVGEGFANTQPAHHDKGHLIDDPGLRAFAAVKSGPCVLDLGGGRLDEQACLCERLPQRVDPRAVRSARGGVTALQENPGRREQSASPLEQFLIGGVRRGVLLIGRVPDGQQPDRLGARRVRGVAAEL